MGGKKKSMASKFAKMSDDERAKYLQLKADQEEEVRRRKEQLLGIFMKNKIKKEDAFSRLNKAKINLEWHHFLRIRKCKEMKENCEHLRRWIERVVNLKNSVIDNLMKELDEAEFQYSNNLQSHLIYVDGIIDFYNNYVEQIKQQYEADTQDLLENALEDDIRIKKKANEQQLHLKTILYGQEIEGNISIRENHDYYLKRKEEYIKEWKAESDHLRKSHEGVSSAIWRNIAATIRAYIEQTDKRRSQLAELRRLDAESSAEIGKNQERIEYEKLQIQHYKEEYKILVQERVYTINGLKEILSNTNLTLLKMKQQLQKDLELDDRQLRILGEYSGEAMSNLERILKKGEHLLHLSQTCRKFETQKEKVLRFCDDKIDEQSFVESVDEPTHYEDKIMKITMGTLPEFKEEVKRGKESPEAKDEPKNQIYKTQKYKILIRHKYKIKSTTSTLRMSHKLQKELEFHQPEPECPKRRAKKKLLPSTSTSDSSETSYSGPSLLDECIDNLLQLDGMWNLCNKVKIDCVELRVEKKGLIEENIALKGMLKEVLEKAVLESRPQPRKEIQVDKLRRYKSAPICFA